MVVRSKIPVKTAKPKKTSAKTPKRTIKTGRKPKAATVNTPLSSKILSKSSNFLPALIIGSLGITSLGLMYKIRQYTRGLTAGDIKFIQETIVSQRNPFAVLGVSPDSTPEQIKQSCRQLYLKYHPDRTKLDQEEAKKMFQEIRPICENMEKKQMVDIFRLIFKYGNSKN